MALRSKACILFFFCISCRAPRRDLFCGVQIMLGVDRLDMIKGIPQKLLAFEKFLEEHPEWRDKVLLVQIAVPTRGDVPEYQVRELVCELAGGQEGGRVSDVQIWRPPGCNSRIVW